MDTDSALADAAGGAAYRAGGFVKNGVVTVSNRNAVNDPTSLPFTAAGSQPGHARRIADFKERIGQTVGIWVVRAVSTHPAHELIYALWSVSIPIPPNDPADPRLKVWIERSDSLRNLGGRKIGQRPRPVSAGVPTHLRRISQHNPPKANERIARESLELLVISALHEYRPLPPVLAPLLACPLVEPVAR